MEIAGVTLDEVIHKFDKVTYVPPHANGNAGHSDCEQGVIISFSDHGVKVLYSKSRSIQITRPDCLVFG